MHACIPGAGGPGAKAIKQRRPPLSRLDVMVVNATARTENGLRIISNEKVRIALRMEFERPPTLFVFCRYWSIKIDTF